MTLVLSILLAQSVSTGTMDKPVKPQRIAGNLYYVGFNDITAFLWATPKGLILLDGGFPGDAGQIEKNIGELGFKLQDLKIILNSQAHVDHAGALAELKRDSGAKVYSVAEAAKELASGVGANNAETFAPVDTDVIVQDGGVVELGGTSIVAHLTPGHTRGCNSWSSKVDGKDAVFVCSLSAPGYKLVDNQSYPNIVDDYRKSFAVLRKLPCDLFFGAHGSFFDLEKKLGKPPGAFVDPKGYQRYLDEAEASLSKQLAGQKQVSKPAQTR
jgi:metallo-beta-lactamase class B